MNYYYGIVYESRADDREDDIQRLFRKNDLYVSIKIQSVEFERVIFRIKCNGHTKFAHLKNQETALGKKLGLKTFSFIKENGEIFLITSPDELQYDHLPKVLQSEEIQNICAKLDLPYIVGYNVFENPIFQDIATFPHLLIGGASGSGKTVSLQSVICNTAFYKSPSEVSIIIADLGAADLNMFKDLPHLSCNIIEERGTLVAVLNFLKQEAARRIALQKSNVEEYNRLPTILIVIDEYTAIFRDCEDDDLRSSISNDLLWILERGRHAKFHMVISAQEASIKNTKISLGNITARIAFKCAEKRTSERIIGYEGAEKLTEKGDLLAKLPDRSEPVKLHGVYITSEELAELIEQIKSKYIDTDNELKFVIPDEVFSDVETESDRLSYSGFKAKEKLAPEDKRLADVIMWALSNKEVSVNALKNYFHCGDKPANLLMQTLEEKLIVTRVYAKTKRKVLPDTISDLTEEMLNFLNHHGYSAEVVQEAFSQRMAA